MNCGADTYTWPSPLGSNAIDGSAPDQYGCFAGSPLGSWLSGPNETAPAWAAGTRQARTSTVRKLERWSMNASVQLVLPAHAGLDAAASADLLTVAPWSALRSCPRFSSRPPRPPRGQHAVRRSSAPA